jgi:hypothetical protein
MRRLVFLGMLVVVLLSVGSTGPALAYINQCPYDPPPCGCWYDFCGDGLYWTECCCVMEPCNSWCGCQPWGYNCAQSWGGCG